MGVIWEIDFDYKKCEQVLFDVALVAFTNLQNNYSYETFLGFAIVPNLNYTKIQFLGYTKEGLERFASQKLTLYRINHPEFEISLEDIKSFFRLQISAFAYVSEHKADDFSSQLSKLLDERALKINVLSKHNNLLVHDDGVTEIESYLHEDMQKTLAIVMNKLDSAYIFEQSNSRNNIVLDVKLSGENTMLSYNTVCLVNPPDVYDEYEILVEHHNLLRNKFNLLERPN